MCKYPTFLTDTLTQMWNQTSFLWTYYER